MSPAIYHKFIDSQFVFDEPLPRKRWERLIMANF